MVHFTALIIIHPSTVNVNNKVQELMLPYDSKIEVEPYKEYLDREELAEKINYIHSLSQEKIDTRTFHIRSQPIFRLINFFTQL